MQEFNLFYQTVGEKWNYGFWLCLSNRNTKMWKSEHHEGHNFIADV